jgi:uncharacterized protein YcfJ
MNSNFKPIFKRHGALLGVCTALTVITVGCGSPAPRNEVVSTVSTTSSNDYRRRPNERVYTVPISSVRAVVGKSEERCWVERERVEGRSGPNVGGAVAGAVVGGIIGHQIGDGHDAATAGGAIVGGAVGSQVGRGTKYEDVKHCETVASNTPDYWDVTYDFNGVRHHVQMLNPPGTTMMVNSRGEPRV